MTAMVERLTSGEGGAVRIEAPGGMGKTSLLVAGRELAEARGVEVHAASAHALETDVPFGVVRRLLEAAVVRARFEHSQLFGDAASLATRLLLGSELYEQTVSLSTALSIQYSLLSVLMDLSQQRPMLLCVDDLHWADDASLRFLVSLLDHAAYLGVGIMVATRPAEPSGHNWLHRLGEHPEMTTLELGALSPAGVGAVVDAHLGPSRSEVAAAFHRATTGNPFLLRALVLAVREQASDPSQINPETIHRLAPRTVTRSVAAQLAAAGPEATRLAEATAVLGDGEPFADSMQLSGLSNDGAEAAHDALVSAGVFADAPAPAFAHPVVQTAVYSELSPRRRAALHSGVADARLERGERIARLAPHIMRSDPRGDDRRVEILRTAAQAALREGAPEIAVRQLHRSLQEPASVGLRAGVLTELGIAEHLAGAPYSEQHLREAIDMTSSPETAAKASLVLGQKLIFEARIPEALGVLDQAVGKLPDPESPMALAVESELLNTALLDARTGKRYEEREALLSERSMAAGRWGACRAWAFLASRAAMDGQPKDVVSELAQRALAGGLLTELGPDAPTAYLPLFALAFVDCLEDASRGAGDAAEEARRRGSPAGFAVARVVRSHVNYRRGALQAAESDVREALDAAPMMPLTLRAMANGYLADVLLEQGHADDALALTEIEIGPETSGALCHVLHARGRALTAVGRLADARRCLTDCGRRLDAIRAANPATVPWRSALATVLLAEGERQTALRLAREELELARRLGAPRTVGISLLAMGRSLPRDQGTDSLEEAVGVLGQSPARLEHARALVWMGAALRRANRRAEAREHLRQGLDLAVRCGADALADEARVEILASGGRTRRELLSGIDALTTSERRIAEMAATGMTRNAIAQSLFVSLKTVDTHLGRVYAKLGVSTRPELWDAIHTAEVPSA
jgi:DNA-binding CsgD family transcriptional regulator